MSAVKRYPLAIARSAWERRMAHCANSRTAVIPSHELLGVVADIASGVGDFATGDEVYGLIRFDRDGAAADFVAVPAAAQ